MNARQPSPCAQRDLILRLNRWERLSPRDPAALAAVRAANGAYFRFIEAELRDGTAAAYRTRFGVTVIRDEGDQLCVVSFEGERYGDAVTYLRHCAKAAGWSSFRMHCDKSSIVRLWRKHGIQPTEYIYEETL